MTFDKIIEAQKILKGIIQETPMVDASLIHPQFWIKAENMQKTGAFKLRGAYHKLSRLTNEEKALGVIAASAGNHAQGVAYSCQKMGIDCTIVMPKSAALSKIEATRSYGVKVELQGNTFNDAYEYARNLQSITKSIFIEPFDDEDVIAGQGTIGLEILEQLEHVDAVVVPIGGGGLASGIALAIKTLKPNCKVYGVQSVNAPSMYESLKQNKITETQVKTMADGIAVKKPGELTFELTKQYIDEVILISEEELAATILILLEKMKMVAEGAGAIAIAAVLFNKLDISDKNVVAVLSGGNIDVNFLAQIIDLGLVKTSRKSRFQFGLSDRPGNLKKIIDILSRVNANVITIEHNRNTSEILARKCEVSVEIETSGEVHLTKVKEAFVFEGYKVTELEKETLVVE